MCFQSAAASPVMEESNGLRAREQSRTQCALSINTKAHSTHRRALSMRRLQNYVTSVPMCFQSAAASPVMEESNGLRAREQSRTQCALSINTKAHSTHRRALSMRRLQNYVTSVPMCFQLAAAASSILFNPFNQKPLNYVPMCFPKSNETPHATPPKTPATPSQSTGCGASRDAAIPARSASHPASCPG